MTRTSDLEAVLQSTVGATVYGVEAAVTALTVALVARGHVLLQGVPGVGKTLLARTVAGALGGTFRRVQGTADLMPSDITGVPVFDPAERRFNFRPGPVFADVLLVDEINRASPKTQSALLEAMEERQVTIDHSSLPLPGNFLVIATQNPQELEGTYPLPESQLDRFLLRIDVGYPEADAEARILGEYGSPGAARPEPAAPRIDAATLAAARAESAAVTVTPALTAYLRALATATRESANVALGLSTRGLVALLQAARVQAAIDGRDYVAPDDVKRMAALVMPHRLQLTPEATLLGLTPGQYVSELLDTVPVPR